MKTHQEFQSFIQENSAVLAYVSGPDCKVCHVMKPKVEDMIRSQFPEMVFLDIDASEAPEISAQLGVFTIPVVIGYFDSREFVRKVRNFSIKELSSELSRPYSMMFEDA